ncbi:MAG: hypothetical protein ACXVB9_01780 [Bdellovibrionota bacterium]
MKNSLLLAAGILGGFALSFLGIGVMWIGLPPLAQFGMAALFCGAAFLLSRFAKQGSFALTTLLIGATPLGAILVQFRDKNDSHLLSILLVCGWMAGAAAGAWLGSPKAPKP